jgi:hypothetical protein
MKTLKVRSVGGGPARSPLVDVTARGGPRFSWVHPTSQYTNLNLLVSGLPVSAKAAHAKI